MAKLQRQVLIGFFLVFTAIIVSADQSTITSSADGLQPAPLTPLAEDGIHDPQNSAIKILQNPIESMQAFPKDRRGEVDWMKALRQGVINPRKSLNGDEFGGKEIMQELDVDILMKNTQFMPYVRFPHLAHTMASVQ